MRGLCHFMGVPDLSASDGVEKLVGEVGAFVEMIRNLSLEELTKRGFAQYARAGLPGRSSSTEGSSPRTLPVCMMPTWLQSSIPTSLPFRGGGE